MFIRISSICFILSVLGSLLYAGWVEADRFFNARTFILNQVQRDHGIRLKVEAPTIESKGVLLADKSEVSLGTHGAGVLEGIRVENHRLFVKSAQLQVFDDNPWQWVAGLCGNGLNVQVQIEQLTIKTALGKSYLLGKFEISSTANQSVKGVCSKFTIEQWSDSVYLAEGDLTAFIPAFEHGNKAEGIKFSAAKNCREINGLGTVSLTISAIDSLVFQLKQPLTIHCAWKGKVVKGFIQSESLNLALVLTPDSVEIEGYGKGLHFEWQGQINNKEEEYQLYVNGGNLSDIFKAGVSSEKYKIPENGQDKINGICEIKRDKKRGKIQVFLESVNKRFSFDEVLP